MFGTKYFLGAVRVGRIPPFVWSDTGTGTTYIEGHESQDGFSRHRVFLKRDASQYQEEFQAALQVIQQCAQHHGQDQVALVLVFQGNTPSRIQSGSGGERFGAIQGTGS